MAGQPPHKFKGEHMIMDSQFFGSAVEAIKGGGKLVSSTGKHLDSLQKLFAGPKSQHNLESNPIRTYIFLKNQFLKIAVRTYIQGCQEKV